MIFYNPTIIERQLLLSEFIIFLKSIDIKINKKLIQAYNNKSNSNAWQNGLLYKNNKNNSLCPRILHFKFEDDIDKMNIFEYYRNVDKFVKFREVKNCK